MPADLCPVHKRAIAIASAEVPGKVMTSLFKKKKKVFQEEEMQS